MIPAGMARLEPGALPEGRSVCEPRRPAPPLRVPAGPIGSAEFGLLLQPAAGRDDGGNTFNGAWRAERAVSALMPPRRGQAVREDLAEHC